MVINTIIINVIIVGETKTKYMLMTIVIVIPVMTTDVVHKITITKTIPVITTEVMHKVQMKTKMKIYVIKMK